MANVVPGSRSANPNIPATAVKKPATLNSYMGRPVGGKQSTSNKGPINRNRLADMARRRLGG